MPEVNSTEALRTWFRKCPLLDPGSRFLVDYLGEQPLEYAIYSSPSTISYHRNVLGEEIPDDVQTVNYIFAAKASYGADVVTNLANLGFFDAVCGWITEQNNARNFPDICGGQVQSILPTLSVYPSELGSDAAKYQIQLKISYRRS